MKSIAAHLAEQYPKSNSDIGARVIPVREQLVGHVRQTLLILFFWRHRDANDAISVHNTIDEFVSRARTLKRQVEVFNLPDADAGFEYAPRSEAVTAISRTVDFLRQQLMP